MFCLLVVLVKLSLLAKWLARKTSLWQPNCGEGIISIKPRSKSVWLSWFIVFFPCLIADIFILSPALHYIPLNSMARYSLFVLKVPLNTMQTNTKTTSFELLFIVKFLKFSLLYRMIFSSTAFENESCSCMMLLVHWWREGSCRPGQRSVVPPLQPATPILSALNKLKINLR